MSAAASAWVVRLAATPSPTPVEVPLSEQASPGVLGFLVTFAVAVAAILLALSLTRHLRIVDRRAAQRARDEEDGALADEDVPGGAATDGTARREDRSGPAAPDAGGPGA